MKKWAIYSFFTLVILIFGIFLTFSQSHAVDYHWIGNTGFWNDPSKWNPHGVPGTGTSFTDNAYLLSFDALDRTVDVTSSFSLQYLTLDATGKGSMTLAIDSTGGISVAGLVVNVGISGSGNVNQTGGVFVAYINTNFGVNPGDTGVYNMRGGSTYFRRFRVAVEGTGIVNQTGGTVDADTSGVGLGGVYNLVSGSVRTDFLGSGILIGGTFNHQGGLASPFYITIDKSGTYNLSGGSLDSGGDK